MNYDCHLKLSYYKIYCELGGKNVVEHITI